VREYLKDLKDFEDIDTAGDYLTVYPKEPIKYQDYLIWFFEAGYHFSKEGKEYPPVNSLEGALFYIDMIERHDRLVSDIRPAHSLAMDADRRAKIEKVYNYGHSVGWDLAEYFDTPELCRDDLVELCLEKERVIGSHQSVYYSDGVMAGIFRYIKKNKRKKA
jgi:hypothetical protein